uniref:Uncharacterized protein n=1 Tax=Rhizophora mucronata TaxID=61149 RepID=A0A2P2QEZ5_RHIMU
MQFILITPYLTFHVQHMMEKKKVQFTITPQATLQNMQGLIECCP